MTDSNPRGGEKIPLNPPKKERYKKGSGAEQVFSRLKEESESPSCGSVGLGRDRPRHVFHVGAHGGPASPACHVTFPERGPIKRGILTLLEEGGGDLCSQDASMLCI